MKKLMMALAAVAATVVYADQINLKSGSKLVGTLVGKQDGVIKFKSDDFGDLDIATGKVESVVCADAKVVKAEEVTEIEKPPETWHGSINIAFNAARGNTYKNGATVLADVNRRWDDDRFAANFGYYYDENGTSRQDKKMATKRWEIEGQWDHFWTQRFYNYLNGRYEQDDIAGIDYRARLGAGLGYQWIEGEDALDLGKWWFSQEAGAAWVETVYAADNDSDRDSVSLRYAHHLKYQPKWYEGVEVFHNFEIMPQCGDFAYFLAKGDVGLTTKIIMNWDLIAKIECDYNSKPIEGREKADMRYIVGLGYKW